MTNEFLWKIGKAHIALKEDGYYVWDSSIIKANDIYYLKSLR